MNTHTNIEDSWLTLAADISDILTTLKPHNEWTSIQKIEKTLAKTLQNLAHDLQYLKDNASFLFAPAEQSKTSTKQTIEFIRQWYQDDKTPSMLSLCIYAANHFKIDINKNLKKTLFIAAILGEVPNTLAYHNTKHYKKVLIQIIRLISVHNTIYHDQPQACDDHDIAVLMLTACIHDLGHDGKGNTINGQYSQARTERHSFDIAMKYFYAIGFNNEDKFQHLMNQIRTMILCTDTSPLGDKNSLTNHMKTVYRQQSKSEKTNADFRLDPELYLLQEHPQLSTMSLLLHEADMASSSSLSYEMTILETASFYQEIGSDEACPENVLSFIDIICDRQVLSDAGEKLYSENMARIIEQAEQAIQDGNHPFPPPEETSFITKTTT